VSEIVPATPEEEALYERLHAEHGDADGSPEAREKLRQELTDQAHRLRERVFAAVAATRTALWEAAPALYDFHEARAWEVLGHRTLKDFLAEPELEIAERQWLRIVGTYRELVIVRKVSPATLAGVDLSKIEPTLPAIKAGDVSIEEAFSDARTLRRYDLREKYSGHRQPDAPLDAKAERPPRVPCEACDGSGWITLEGGEP
jgi:hypothetical protein